MEFNYTRNMGVEIECFDVYHEDLAYALSEAGIPVYNTFTETKSLSGPHWKITEDGSIEMRHAVELVSPVLSGIAAFEQVRKVCEILKKLGAKVGKTCGLHVHVDARDLTPSTIRDLIHRYDSCENTIDKFMPDSRREDNNEFCYSMQTATYIELHEDEDVTDYARKFYHDSHHGRYYKLNVAAFLRHGTVEFRHHSGTIMAEKIINWMIFCVTFVETTKALGSRLPAFEGLAPEIVEYFNERARLFA